MKRPQYLRLNMWKALSVIAAFALAHQIHAAVLVDFDASALAPVPISAWKNQATTSGTLTNIALVRVESIQNRAAVARA